MKTVSILPFLCVLAAAAPTLSGPGKEVDIDRRQATDDGNDAGLGGLLGGSDSENGLLSGLRRRQSSSNNNKNNNNNNDNDDSLANLLDGSTLAVDGNGQNVDIADLGSLLRNRRRQLLHVPAPGATRNSDDNDNSNSEQVANVLDGSAAGIDRNAQNISVVKRITKRQLLGGLGHEEGGEVEGNGNGDDDESLLNVLDGDTADVSRNIQNVTILRRHPRTSSSTSVSKRGWLSALFLGRRGTPTTSSDSNNGDNDDTLANVLDGSAAGVNDNAQGVSVLRRRQASPSSSSASASTPTPTPSASASASAVPIAQDPPAAAPAPAPAPAARAEEPASHPVVNAADNDNNDNNNNNASNDDALLNAADNSGTSVDRNLQNITILRQKRSHVDDSGNADDDDTLANVADGSALKADGNGQGVDVGDLL